jgi:molecular chaperone DnaJ
MLGAMQTRVSCHVCDGRGDIPESPCTDCKGSGVLHGKKQLTITIPPGVEHGMRLRVRGEGEAAPGAAPGDLFVRLHVEDDKRFEREGHHLFTEVHIGVSQAALGDELLIETLDEKLKLKVPAGVQPGERLRIKGKGVPHGRGRGDLYVEVVVDIPKKLSRKERKLFEELDLRA